MTSVYVPGMSSDLPLRSWQFSTSPGSSRAHVPTLVRNTSGLQSIRRLPGLTGQQLALTSVPPSNLSLLGLVRHMADVERAWFRIAFRGEPLPRLYKYEDVAFEHADPARAEADFAAFHQECELARKGGGPGIPGRRVHRRRGSHPVAALASPRVRACAVSAITLLPGLSTRARASNGSRSPWATPLHSITLNTYVGEWPDTDQETSAIMDAVLGQVPRMCPSGEAAWMKGQVVNR